VTLGPQLLLVASVTAVGVLHTIVPDHWVPIALIARQRGWSKAETARAALQAGTGHVLSTLLIALAIWLMGVAFAERFGHVIDTVSSLALIAFGAWIAASALRDLRRHAGHEHGHHEHGHDHVHRHDHEVAAGDDKTKGRTALLLIVGSSPMVEGIPAFFAAAKYGVGLIAVMAVAFAVSTISTYVLLCVYSTAGLQRMRLGAFERYGEVMSGAFIVFVGVAFWIWSDL